MKSKRENQQWNVCGKIGWRKIGMKGLRWMGWRKDKDRRDSFLWETAVQLPDKLQLKIPNQTRMLTQLAGEKTLLRIATSWIDTQYLIFVPLNDFNGIAENWTVSDWQKWFQDVWWNDEMLKINLFLNILCLKFDIFRLTVVWQDGWRGAPHQWSQRRGGEWWWGDYNFEGRWRLCFLEVIIHVLYLWEGLYQCEMQSSGPRKSLEGMQIQKNQDQQFVQINASHQLEMQQLFFWPFDRNFYFRCMLIRVNYVTSAVTANW